METKQCNICKKTKPIEEFYKNKGMKSGLYNYCKSCTKEQVREWQKNNPESVKRNRENWDVKNPDYKINYWKIYRETHPKSLAELEKYREYNRIYRENNPDKLKEKHRNHYLKYRDGIKKRAKEYYHKNKDSLTDTQQEKLKEWQKEYYKKNKDKIKEYTKNWVDENIDRAKAIRTKRKYLRKTRLKNAVYENVVPVIVYEKHNWICGICGKKINKKLKYPDPQSVSLDHILPISKGGSHTYINIQSAHLVCNVGKGAKVINAQLSLQTA